MAIMLSRILVCERRAIFYFGAVSTIRPELPEKRFYDVCFYQLTRNGYPAEGQEEKAAVKGN
jgi:hypothetical protein